MRIVFVGAVEFSHFCLTRVLEQGGNVVAVFNPPRDSARGNSDWCDLEPLAQSFAIPLHRFGKIGNPDTVEQIRALQPDVIFAWGLSQLIPAELLRIPPIGCIGSHPALLPLNRGRHPLIWALVEGLSQSGLSFFYMDEGADSGDILWQRPFDISLQDDAASLYRKVKVLAGEAIAEFLPLLADGTARRAPQDHTKATYWRKRGEADGVVNWQAPSMQSYNLIRALTRPYVGAHTLVEGRRVILWRSKLVPEMLAEAVTAGPGTVVRLHSDSMLVRTGDGLIDVVDWQAEEGVTLKCGIRFDPVASSVHNADAVNR
jgi:methionyl-tRNA formyltransferase